MTGPDLLLRAALLSGPDAIAAWNSWQSAHKLDDADAATYRLLPLVERNLEALGVEHPDMGRLKGIRRRTWVKNQSTVREGAIALRVLETAGIRTLVLRGAALLVRQYQDMGLRPMADFDVLVPSPDAVEAIKVLKSTGWQTVETAPADVGAGFRAFHNSLLFKNDSGAELALHWHALALCPSEDADQLLWDASETMEVLGVQTRALNPSDQFVYACLSLIEWRYAAPVWWVADALTILGQPGAVDFRRIMLAAEELRVSHFLRPALEILKPFGGENLEALTARFSANSSSWADRLEYAFVSRPDTGRSVPSWLVAAVRRFARSGRRNPVSYLASAFRWGLVPRLIRHKK